ncbi:unnamed protein product [Trifolium pratense]|uniref:Uncharacterized protein n=1 Tax=Trifolium pratense TaxID=57577 RepID=A0ACB0L9D5_TRIPR|nr:unnamed protein product [Trifolium pratense]
MGRGRISMELIQKEKSRRTTFQKRKKGLIKKVEEFAILCDVDVCLILYAPNFEGQGYAEPEIWPKEPKVRKILQKYYNTTNDRRPKIYDVQEYYKERMKKVEFEISKVRKEMLKIMYPTWEESFNSLGEEQMRLFAGLLDAKLDACNQKMNMLKGDVKGKRIAHESHKVDKPNIPYLTSNSNTYFNFMPNNMSLPQIYPPLMNIADKNPFGFWPLHLGQSSQPSSTLSSAQGSNQMESDEGRYAQSYPGKQVDANWTNWTSQIDANISYDPKTGTKKKNGAENDENLLPYYYNGNAMTMQSYPIGMHTLPFQNLQNLPPHGYQFNGFYDMDILQAHMFNNYMDGRK